MRKILLLLAACLMPALTALAQSYTENLVVSVNGESSEPAPATIEVERAADGLSCSFKLNNFMLTSGESSIPVGNIALTGVTLTQKQGYSTIAASQTITIAPGDESLLPAEGWMGPMLGQVPIELQGKLTDSRLYAVINIDMTATLGQTIKVTIGTDNVTAIQAVTAAADKAARTTTLEGVYTLSGQRVAAKPHAGLPKGLYIVNGVKQAVR